MNIDDSDGYIEFAIKCTDGETKNIVLELFTLSDRIAAAGRDVPPEQHWEKLQATLVAEGFPPGLSAATYYRIQTEIYLRVAEIQKKDLAPASAT